MRCPNGWPSISTTSGQSGGSRRGGGSGRNGPTGTNPNLVPYVELPDSEKEYDRSTVFETLKAIIALGYRIVPPDD